MVEESAAGLFIVKFSLTTTLYKFSINEKTIQNNVINEIGKAQMIVNIWGVIVMVAFRTMFLRTWFDSGPPNNRRVVQRMNRGF